MELICKSGGVVEAPDGIAELLIKSGQFDKKPKPKAKPAKKGSK